MALVLLGVGFGAYRILRQKKAALSFQSAKFTRLTSTGKSLHAAISPDGKWLVRVIDDGGQQSLWLKQVARTARENVNLPSEAATSSSLELVLPPSHGRLMGNFSLRRWEITPRII